MHENIRHLEPPQYNAVIKVLAALVCLLIFVICWQFIIANNQRDKITELEQELVIADETMIELNQWANEVEWQRDSLQVKLDEFTPYVPLDGYSLDLNTQNDPFVHMNVFVEKTILFDSWIDALNAYKDFKDVLNKHMPRDPEVYEGSARGLPNPDY